jgi:hypothetical protein
LLAQISRVLEINEMRDVSRAVVEAVRESLVIIWPRQQYNEQGCR